MMQKMPTRVARKIPKMQTIMKKSPPKRKANRKIPRRNQRKLRTRRMPKRLKTRRILRNLMTKRKLPLMLKYWIN